MSKAAVGHDYNLLAGLLQDELSNEFCARIYQIEVSRKPSPFFNKPIITVEELIREFDVLIVFRFENRQRRASIAGIFTAFLQMWQRNNSGRCGEIFWGVTVESWMESLQHCLYGTSKRRCQYQGRVVQKLVILQNVFGLFHPSRREQRIGNSSIRLDVVVSFCVS